MTNTNSKPEDTLFIDVPQSEVKLTLKDGKWVKTYVFEPKKDKKE